MGVDPARAKTPKRSRTALSKRWVFHLHSAVPLTALLRTSVLGQLTSKVFGSISHESLSSLCLRILDDLCFLRKHSMIVKSLRLHLAESILCLRLVALDVQIVSE